MIKNFFEYLKNPVSTDDPEIFTFKIYFKLIVLGYLLVFMSSIFVAIIRTFNVLPHYFNPKIDSLKGIDSIFFFLFVILVGPLIEEILCRLNLKITKLNIAVFFAVLIPVIIKLIFFRAFHLYFYLSSLPLFIGIYYAINRFGFASDKIEIFVKSKFKYVFHLSAIVFGMIHLTNYDTIYWWMIVIIPLLTAPYISMGYLFGYVRMKYGFVNGFLMHSTVNFISVLLVMTKHFIHFLQ
ncbi:MAG: CPBP family intramembrane metalloprotease [Mariniphaga sp.]|nr:CPBP family intramembrane metalloprotease [Mariniphaga sp.]